MTALLDRSVNMDTNSYGNVGDFAEVERQGYPTKTLFSHVDKADDKVVVTRAIRETPHGQRSKKSKKPARLPRKEKGEHARNKQLSEVEFNKGEYRHAKHPTFPPQYMQFSLFDRFSFTQVILD